MAVVYHALQWDMTNAGCTAARTAAALACAGDEDGLSRMGEALYRQAYRQAYRQVSAFGSVLAALGLDDRDHVLPWLAPKAVSSALVTVLAWVPEMVLLDPVSARMLASRHRHDGSPVAPLTPVGDAFLPLARALQGVFGHAPLAMRPTAGDLGVWVRALRLQRRLTDSGDAEGAASIPVPVDGTPYTRWLVSVTRW